MNLHSLDTFLADAVFYPCCGFDGAPVKFLKRFRNFVYVDYHVSTTRFVREAQEHGFRGYRLDSVADLPAEAVLGESWAELSISHQGHLERLPLEWSTHNFGIVLLGFRRLSDFPVQHGPEHLQILFVCFEAIATLHALFTRRHLTPKVLCAIRPGIALGGNYNDFPKHLDQAIRDNPAGYPSYLLHDGRAGNRSWGDYLPLTREYDSLIAWDYQTEGYGPSSLTFSERHPGIRPPS